MIVIYNQQMNRELNQNQNQIYPLEHLSLDIQNWY